MSTIAHLFQMKIAMIGQKGIPARSGGVERHVELLSRNLADRGHEVIVYCRRSYCGREARSSRDGLLRRIVLPSIPTKHLDALSHSFAATIDIALRRADLVHYHAIGPASLAPLARLAGLPVVVTVHALDWRRAKWGRAARACLRAGERLAVGWAHKLVVVSPVLREYMARAYGATAEFIPNGVEPLAHRDPEKIAAWEIEPRRYILTVARLVPEKGLHVLIRAFTAATDGTVKLVIAGSGGGFDRNYERHLHELAGDRVVFTGEADRELLAELYSHALLFVLPSTLEGMSIALLEAMQMGVPVLVSDIPENTRIVGDAGFTHRAGDANDLAAKLVDLLGDPRRLAKYGKDASKRATPYRWPAVTEKLEAVYRACCGTNSQPSRPPNGSEGTSHGSGQGPKS